MKVVCSDKVVMNERLEINLFLQQRVHRNGGRAGIFHLTNAVNLFDNGDADGTMGFFRVRPI